MSARASRCFALEQRERWIRRRWARFLWVREWDRFQELNRLNKGQRPLTRRTRGAMSWDTRYHRCREKRDWTAAHIRRQWLGEWHDGENWSDYD